MLQHRSEPHVHLTEEEVNKLVEDIDFDNANKIPDEVKNCNICSNLVLLLWNQKLR